MAVPLTREAVVTQARQMVETEGLEELSLRKLAGRLGVTAPALYAHVGSKAELLRAVAEEAFRELIGRFQVSAGMDPLDRIRTMSAQYVDFARSHPQLFRTMFLFRPDFTAESRGDELALATDTFEFAAGPVHDAVAAGLLGETDPVMASLVFWAAVHGVATVILAGPELGRDVEDAVLTEVVETLLAGMRRSG